MFTCVLTSNLIPAFIPTFVHIKPEQQEHISEIAYISNMATDKTSFLCMRMIRQFHIAVSLKRKLSELNLVYAAKGMDISGINVPVIYVISIENGGSISSIITYLLLLQL